MANTGMSPLLKNRIQAGNPAVVTTPQTNGDLNAVYENLKLHAGEAKPNAAKAKLINDSFVKRTVDAIKDTGADCKNYVKAVKTGDLNDNQIGRINDLGLKVGAGLIATFLALNAKSKKMAMMEFVGAATFLATMKLWPKLFINLPAKLVHGFSIDKKYMSAQGEKKDFFLDNQFLPWDVYSKEELAEIGKKTGIDINSPNGEEKIKRKMQKTALQNRTLWMATAGFATPLMTSLACSAAEPYIDKSIVQDGFNKVKKTISKEGMKEFLNAGKMDKKLLAKSEAQLDQLFEGNATGMLDDSFFEKLISKLGVSSLRDEFRNPDDFRVIESFNSAPALHEELRTLYDNSAVYQKEGLVSSLLNLSVKNQGMSTLSKEEIEAVVKKLGDNYSYSDLARELREMGCEPSLILKIKSKALGKTPLATLLQENPLRVSKEGGKLTRGEIENLLGNGPLTVGRVRQLFSDPAKFNQEEVEGALKKVEVDNSAFIKAVKTFNKEFVVGAKSKIMQFAKLVNPVAGQRSHSVYTKEYTNTIKTLFKEMGVTDKQLKEILAEDPQVKVPKVLQEFFVGKVRNPEEYETFIKGFYEKVQTPDDVARTMTSLNKGASMLSSKGVKAGSKFKGLAQALLGDRKESKGIVEVVRSFLSKNTTNVETFKAKILLISGLERRIQSGELAKSFKEQGLVSDAFPVEKLIQLAREAVYSSSASNAANKFGVPNGYKIFRDIVFDSNAYKVEKGISMQAKEGVERAIKFMTEEGDVTKESYIGASNFADQVKTAARSMRNNKIWKKIFVTSAIALAAVTLLAQPFFGKIKKEYPENKKGENK